MSWVIFLFGSSNFQELWLHFTIFMLNLFIFQNPDDKPWWCLGSSSVTWRRFIHLLCSKRDLWKETTNFASFTCPDGRGRRELLLFSLARAEQSSPSSQSSSRVGGTTWKRKHGKRGTPSLTPPYHYMEELLSPHITRRESIKQPRSMHPVSSKQRKHVEKPQKAF